MGAGASCGPDLNRDKVHDEIILTVSRQLFWGRVSCQEHTPPCPLCPLMKVWIPGSFYPKQWESLGLFSSPVMGSLEAGRKVVSPAGFHFTPECWNFPWAPDLPVFLQHMASFWVGGNIPFCPVSHSCFPSTASVGWAVISSSPPCQQVLSSLLVISL